MFLISLTYTAPLDQLDRVRADHRAWLDQGIADGWLLLAGDSYFHTSERRASRPST